VLASTLDEAGGAKPPTGDACSRWNSWCGSTGRCPALCTGKLARLSTPLALLPVWNHSWRQGAALAVWAANPVVFPKPAHNRALPPGPCSARRSRGTSSRSTRPCGKCGRDDGGHWRAGCRLAPPRHTGRARYGRRDGTVARLLEADGRLLRSAIGTAPARMPRLWARHPTLCGCATLSAATTSPSAGRGPKAGAEQALRGRARRIRACC